MRPPTVVSMENETVTSIDFETTEVPFFNKKGKTKLNANGHPRFAKIKFGTYSDGNLAYVSDNPYALSLDKATFHNLAFDALVGIQNQIWTLDDLWLNKPDCTLLMAELLDSERLSALKSLARTELGALETIQYQQVDKNDAEAFYEYAKKDALYTAQLHKKFRKELKNSNQWALYREVEAPFALVNLECGLNGFTIQAAELLKRLFTLKENVKTIEIDLNAGINLSSPKQLKRYVYGELNQPLGYLKGKVSTSRKVLLKNNHPQIQKIVKRSGLISEAKEIETLLRFIDRETSRVHPHIKTLGAETGRTTSSLPNLQNISKESSLREHFIASDGYKLIVLDFSQIEPRVLAHFLNPSPFSSLFESEEDFYTRLAREVFSESSGETPPRSVAKQVILAIFYGMAAKTLGENLKVSPKVAQAYLDKFFEVYPEIQVFKNRSLDLARSQGFASGLLNRRRYISDLYNKDEKMRAGAERQVLNAVIQGSAATIFKYKLVKLREILPREVRFLLHVHDEVILEAPESMANEIFNLSKQHLEKPLPWFSIPLKVEGGVGLNWAQAKNA